MNKTLEYVGTLLAISGALFIALDINQLIGYILFMASGAFLIPQAYFARLYGLLTMQAVFAIINFLGLLTRV